MPDLRHERVGATGAFVSHMRGREEAQELEVSDAW